MCWLAQWDMCNVCMCWWGIETKLEVDRYTHLINSCCFYYFSRNSLVAWKLDVVDLGRSAWYGHDVMSMSRYYVCVVPCRLCGSWAGQARQPPLIMCVSVCVWVIGKSTPDTPRHYLLHKRAEYIRGHGCYPGLSLRDSLCASFSCISVTPVFFYLSRKCIGLTL